MTLISFDKIRLELVVNLKGFGANSIFIFIKMALLGGL